MVSSKRIYPGCRVEGRYGPLQPNPNPNIKRRVREMVVGTVLRAAEQRKWEVLFDFAGKSRTVTSNSLKVVDGDHGVPLDELHNASDVDVDDAEEDQEVEGCPNNNFCWTEEDFLDDMNQFIDNIHEASRHRNAYQSAWAKINGLEGHQETVSSAKDGSITWRVVPDILLDELKDARERYRVIFLTEKSCPIQNVQSLKDNMTFVKGFWISWPLKVDDCVVKVNVEIEKENLNRKEHYQRPIKKMEIQEFFTFNALLIAASLYNDRGVNLWPENTNDKRKAGFSSNVDFGKYMKFWRFKELKHYIPYVMSDESLQDSDDWWRVRRIISEYSRKRKGAIFTSHTFIYDESMSAFVPRTTKTGKLPNISYIQRKPEPLGTEFKCIVDGFTGIMLWLEVQEGKERMKSK